MYYVSVINGKQYGLLLGPFTEHEAALAMVEPVRKLAHKLDPWAWFFAYGTCKMPASYNKPGVLNDRFREGVL